MSDHPLERNPPTVDLNQRLIHVGLSEAFNDKRLRPGAPGAFGQSFKQCETTLDAFVDHVLAGKANVPARFKGNTRRNDTFISADVLALDMELPAERDVTIAEALAIPFVRDHALLIHPTASSGEVTSNNPHGYKRIRLYFLASEAIEGLERARTLFRALAAATGMRGVDASSFKPTQPYFGSTNRIETPYVNLSAPPVDLRAIAVYLEDAARIEMEHTCAPMPPIHNATGSRATSYAVAAKNGILDDYCAIPGGEGKRHRAFVRMAVKLYERRNWPGFENIDSDIRRVGHATDRAPAEIEGVIKWTAEQAAFLPLELPSSDFQASNPDSEPLELPAKPLRYLHQFAPWMLVLSRVPADRPRRPAFQAWRVHGRATRSVIGCFLGHREINSSGGQWNAAQCPNRSHDPQN